MYEDRANMCDRLTQKWPPGEVWSSNVSVANASSKKKWKMCEDLILVFLSLHTQRNMTAIT